MHKRQRAKLRILRAVQPVLRKMQAGKGIPASVQTDRTRALFTKKKRIKMIDLTRCTKFLCILFDFFLLLVLPILYKKQYNLYCKAMLHA
ncbi:hypothetical protein DXA92_01085 [Agathobaculum butyriciproducens]|nr:hypothetical protein DXA92_01085 [Agathobaculum butyriciproducens]